MQSLQYLTGISDLLRNSIASDKRLYTIVKTKILLLTLVVALSTIVFGQPNASLHGVVTDPSNAAIPAATVIATGSDGKVKTASTDQLGRYTLAGLAPGSYTVRIGAKGFTLFEKAGVALSPGQSVAVDAALTVTLEKQEVTVNSEDRQTQISTDPAEQCGGAGSEGRGFECSVG